jgi:hypothetical protein
MSQSQAWPLSQKANKQNGICSVCFATRQLHVKDGTIHQHGPRLNPCTGSNLPPVHRTSPHTDSPSSGSQSIQQTSISGPSTTAEALHISTSNTSAANIVDSVTTMRHISHSSYSGPIIKHIPRSARPHITTELVNTINQVISNPEDPSVWSSLLEFGPAMLHAPPRTGRRHNLATVLMKRSTSSDPAEVYSAAH